MKIAVCIKQVPATNDTKMDSEKGTLIRNSSVTCNPYDLYAIEAALQLKEMYGGDVTAFSMGPSSAESTLRQSLAMGVDEAVLICDRAFAGADVLATSYTLYQAIQANDTYDIILFGRQTTDGDTAQVGCAVAKYFDYPCISWVTKILSKEENRIYVIQEGSDIYQECSINLPCVLTVNKEINEPRIPNLRAKLAAKKKEIKMYSLNDLKDSNENHYGQNGSATRVRRIYPYIKGSQGKQLQGTKEENIEKVINWLILAKNKEFEKIKWD